MSDILKAAALQAAATITAQEMQAQLILNKERISDDDIRINLCIWYEKLLSMLTFDDSIDTSDPHFQMGLADFPPVDPDDIPF